jgi:hypothetical protein
MSSKATRKMLAKLNTDQSPSQQESSVVGNVVKLLSPTSNESDVKNDQHYIDDLRAGAFQYVEADSADHTKPYQVHQSIFHLC